MRNTVGSVRAKVAAGCALVAAVIWLIVWLHQYHSHGRTSVNEMRLVLGLTWMDAAKVLPLALLLLLPGLDVVIERARVHHGRRDNSRAGVVLGRIAEGAVLVAAVAGAVDFWPFPTGSYAVTFESRGDNQVPFQFLASVVAGAVLIALAVTRRSAGDREAVALLLLGSGALTSSLWTPVLLWPVVAWAGFGGWLWWSAGRRPVP